MRESVLECCDPAQLWGVSIATERTYPPIPLAKLSLTFRHPFSTLTYRGIRTAPAAGAFVALGYLPLDPQIYDDTLDRFPEFGIPEFLPF